MPPLHRLACRWYGRVEFVGANLGVSRRARRATPEVNPPQLFHDRRRP